MKRIFRIVAVCATILVLWGCASTQPLPAYLIGTWHGEINGAPSTIEIEPTEIEIIGMNLVVAYTLQNNEMHINMMGQQMVVLVEIIDQNNMKTFNTSDGFESFWTRNLE